MKTYELTPNNGRKSFYGKAIVQISDNGEEVLLSYNTPIVKRVDGKLIRLWSGWTATTGSHIKSFCGLDKKEFMNLPKEYILIT